MWVSVCVWKTHEHEEHTVQTFFMIQELDNVKERIQVNFFNPKFPKESLSHDISCYLIHYMEALRISGFVLKEETSIHMNERFKRNLSVMWFMKWALHPSKRSEDLPKCTSSSPRHKSYFLLSHTRTNIRLWWIGQSNNSGTLIQNWYKDISLVTIWSRSSRGCWQEAFWHSLQAIWGALIESAATISQQWISALKEVAGIRRPGIRMLRMLRAK